VGLWRQAGVENSVGATSWASSIDATDPVSAGDRGF